MVSFFFLFVTLAFGAFNPELKFVANSTKARSFQPETPSIQLFTTNIDLSGTNRLYLANYAGYDPVKEWNYDCIQKELMFVCEGQTCFFRLWYFEDGVEVAISQPTLSAEYATTQLEVGSFSSTPDVVFTRYIHNGAVVTMGNTVSHQFVSGLRVFSSCSSISPFCVHDGVADDSFPTNSIYFSGTNDEFSPPNANAGGCNDFFDASAVDPLVLTWSDGHSIPVKSCGLAYTLEPLDVTPQNWCPPSVVTGSSTQSLRMGLHAHGYGYVDNPNPPLPVNYLDNTGSDSFTYEFWMYFTGNFNEIPPLISIFKSSVFDAYVVRIDADYAKIHFVFKGDSGEVYDMELVSYQRTVGWDHFAAVRDASNDKYYLYRNGVQIFDGASNSEVSLGTATCAANGCASTDQNGIASIGDSYFIGYIDEVRVWKSARSQADISTYYQQSIISANNLLFSMTFEEDPPIDQVTLSTFTVNGDAVISPYSPF